MILGKPKLQSILDLVEAGGCPYRAEPAELTEISVATVVLLAEQLFDFPRPRVTKLSRDLSPRFLVDHILSASEMGPLEVIPAPRMG